MQTGALRAKEADARAAGGPPRGEWPRPPLPLRPGVPGPRRPQPGAVAWQTFTTSDQTLEHPKYGAGVGVWSSPAIDPLRHRLYIGTGNFYEPGSANPSPASAGDRDLSDSLLALNTNNGVLTHHRQFTAGDVWG